MNKSRRTFLASIVTWLTALPLVRAFSKKPKSFDFHIRFEEIGEERYRATLNCGIKRAIIESPVFDDNHPVINWSIQARIGFLFEVQKAMKILAFPQDALRWNSPVFHWFENDIESVQDHETFMMEWNKREDLKMYLEWQKERNLKCDIATPLS